MSTFGGGTERLLLAVENQRIYSRHPARSVITAIEKQTDKSYQKNETAMRIVTDQILGSCFISAGEFNRQNRDGIYHTAYSTSI